MHDSCVEEGIEGNIHYVMKQANSFVTAESQHNLKLFACGFGYLGL